MLKQSYASLLLISSFAYGMVNVTIDETIYSPEEICEKILAEQVNPQMIAWYIGESGITKNGAQFYQNKIFNHFKQMQAPHKFHLYDLAAWQGLRIKQASIATKNKMAQHVDTLKHPNYSSLYSADFLQDLMTEDNEEIIKYIRETILRNPHLYIHSENRKDTNIKLRDVLPARSLEPIHDLDTAHTYSALQYLEGIFLIKKLAELDSEASEQNIVFLLANDEYKYYVSEHIETDMNVLLNDQIAAKKRIHATFNCFKFGETIHERPYISHDKKATKQDLNDCFS